MMSWGLSLLVSAAQAEPVAASAIYVLLLAASIVLLPLSSLPLLPLAAAIFGVWIGGLLSILGWWIGAMIAFLLARYVGRPLLQYVVSLDKLDRWEERFPKDVTFAAIVLLRMVMPIDLPSFALGLIRTLPFSVYALATLIGITPFAFAWMLLGGAFVAGQWLLVAFIGSAMTLIAFLLQRWYRKRSKR